MQTTDWMAGAMLGASMLALGCGSQCEKISPLAESVCHVADAGSMEPGRSFVLEVETTAYGGAGASCVAVIDGGSIAFSLTATVCPANNWNNPVVAPPAMARCEVPALDAGSYLVATRIQMKSLVLGPGDSGVVGCRR